MNWNGLELPDKEMKMDNKEKQVIRAGLLAGGLSEYLCQAVILSDYETQGGGHAFTIELNFGGSFALSPDVPAINRHDALNILAKDFARDFQVKLLSEIPLGYVGNKVILTQEAYIRLRRLASTSRVGSYGQVYDSEFGRQFGTHP